MRNTMFAAVVLSSLLVSTASAELPHRLPLGEGRTIVAPYKPHLQPPPNPHAVVSKIIYLERCKGGCTVRAGTDDSRG